MKALKIHEIPGRVAVSSGNGGLPVIRVQSDFSSAEIYPHGAHLTGFQPHGEAPLLFMSAASEFHVKRPIRGGVPVIFPWFGGREGMNAHGFARLAEWDLVAVKELLLGSIKLGFQMPADDPYRVTFEVTIGRSLLMELAVANTDDVPFTFETCLHTYFQVGDIHQVRIEGLQGARYRDQLFATELTETADAIRFSAETDRVYQNTGATVAIADPSLDRTIVVSKTGSKSTVVWNPWIGKSARMPDFGDEEYLRMVCVESGNIREHAITLAPGEEARLTVEVSSVPISERISVSIG